MQIEIFIVQMNRLFANFCSELSENAKKAKINFFMSEILDKYSDEAMIYAVERILNDENIKKFPSLAQLKTYLREKNKTVHKESCPICEHTGYFTIWQIRRFENNDETHSGKYYPFAYRCNCPLGNSFRNLKTVDPKAIPERAHNPFPPDNPKHKEFNNRKPLGLT
jgi:hypothetical protein